MRKIITTETGPALRLWVKGEPVLSHFSEEDLEIAKGYLWRVHPDGGLYAIHEIAFRRTSLVFHRMAAVAPPGIKVQHLDGNKLNNRRENLKLVRPTSKEFVDRLLGGVWPHGRSGLWTAMILVDHQLYPLGIWRGEAHARMAYRRAMLRFNGVTDRHCLNDVEAMGPITSQLNWSKLSDCLERVDKAIGSRKPKTVLRPRTPAR